MRVAFWGTGLMGRPMAHRLLQKKHEVFVYNRTRSKAEWLADKGAKIADKPGETLEGAEAVVMMLADAAAIRAVLAQVPRERIAGRTFVQMGTILPEESKEFQKEIEACGGQYLEAPVLGSVPEAQAGRLFVFVSGELERFHALRSLLEAFGEQIYYLGPVGKASTLKLALNQLIASHMIGFSLSLGLLERAEVDVDLFLNVLRQSALYAPMFEKKLPRLRDRNWANPNFPTKWMLKDVRLVLREAERRGLQAEHLEAFARLFERALELGHGNHDYSSVYEAISGEGKNRGGVR